MAQPATRTNWWGGQERVAPVAPRWQTPPPASGGQQQPNASAGQSPTLTQQGGDYSAYRPQQGGYSAYNPGQAQPTQQPSFGTAYNPQQSSPYPYGGQTQAPPFQFRATDFMGNQFNNPGEFTSQQGAMLQALNQQRSQQIGNMFTQGTPMGSLDPFAAYGQGQQMLQDGFQNPFAPPGMGQQPMGQQPGGQFQDLFQQFGFAPPPGFMDALIQRLGGQQGGQPPGQSPPPSIAGMHKHGDPASYKEFLLGSPPGQAQPGFTTMAMGEEGSPQRPGQAQPDFGVATTMAMGEEGSPQRPGQAQPVQQPSQGTPYNPPAEKQTERSREDEMQSLQNELKTEWQRIEQLPYEQQREAKLALKPLVDRQLELQTGQTAAERAAADDRRKQQAAQRWEEMKRKQALEALSQSVGGFNKTQTLMANRPPVPTYSGKQTPVQLAQRGWLLEQAQRYGDLDGPEQRANRLRHIEKLLSALPAEIERMYKATHGGPTLAKRTDKRTLDLYANQVKRFNVAAGAGTPYQPITTNSQAAKPVASAAAAKPVASAATPPKSQQTPPSQSQPPQRKKLSIPGFRLS
jgi:hypothetical protein